jgi:hypothetical protein
MRVLKASRLSAGAVTSTYAPDAALDLLSELVALHRQDIELQRQILAALEHPQRAVSAMSRGDRAILARLLPAAGGVFGSEPFLTRDLFESDSAALTLVLRGLNVRQVGRLFRRGEGLAIDAYMIQRDGVELHAILWRILKA